MTLFAKVLILFVIVCLPEVHTELGKPDVFRNNEKSATNSSNTSTTCHFHILESSLKSVLKLMQNSKTNAIKLNLWIESINDTMTLMNKDRMPTDMLWVNELGRTLYSLKLETEQYVKSLISYLPDVTLTAGFRDVNIVVSEDNERCLLSKNNTMDDAIFYVLLSQLDSLSDVKTDYQFCYTHNFALNCCRIFPGDKSIRMCSYYSSPVLHACSIIDVTVTCFAFYFLIPVLVDYLNQYKEKKHYPISSSPMALSYIFYVIFMKGQGPVKTPVRKLLIVTFAVVILLPVRNIDPLPWTIIFQYVLLCVWMIIFFLLNFDTDGLSAIQNEYSLLEIISFPFNILLFGEILDWSFSQNTRSTNQYTLLNDSDELLQTTNDGHTDNGDDEDDGDHKDDRDYRNDRNDRDDEDNGDDRGDSDDGDDRNYDDDEDDGDDEGYLEYSFQRRRMDTVEIWKWPFYIFITILLYFINLAFSLLSTSMTLAYICTLIFYKQKAKILERLFRVNFGLAVFYLLAISFMHFFHFMMLFTIGVFLNGETYINYFLPLSTILFYSWTNWKSSVETKYLVLSTCIYEVCKDSTLDTPDIRFIRLANFKRKRNESISKRIKNAESNVNLIFVIKLNDDGEPMIPTELYHLVRGRFLPYHRVLFHYFTGIFIVTVFAYFLYTMMSLSDNSGVTSTVQILGSMAATALPILFNLIWKHSSDEEKEANAIALKSKLKRVLKNCSLNKNKKKILVQLTMGQKRRNPMNQAWLSLYGKTIQKFNVGFTRSLRSTKFEDLDDRL